MGGTGKLSASERKRRAREIVAESGADTADFNKVVEQQKEGCVTFKQQSSVWLEHLRARKRKPVAAETIVEWERILNKEIIPQIGQCPIAVVNNGVLKKLVALYGEEGIVGKSYRELPPSSENGRCIGLGRRRKSSLSAQMESRVHGRSASEVEAEYADLFVRSDDRTGEMEEPKGTYAVHSLQYGWLEDKRGTGY